VEEGKRKKKEKGGEPPKKKKKKKKVLCRGTQEITQRSPHMCVQRMVRHGTYILETAEGTTGQ